MLSDRSRQSKGKVWQWLKNLPFTESLAYWLLPPGFRHLLTRILADSGPPLAESPNFTFSELRDSHRGKRCFILATGPSVQKQDLSVLSGELCISVSFFFLHEYIKQINPAFHVLAPNHHPFDDDLIKRYLDGIKTHLTDQTQIVWGHLPYEFSIKKCLERSASSLANKIRVLDFSASEPLSPSNFDSSRVWDLDAKPFPPRTVVYTAIQLAVYLGCSEIYLIGCDHDYLSDLRRRENHFYLEKRGNPSDEKHLNDFSTERWFEEYFTRWRDYRLMNSYLSSRGIKVYNATEGGMLDVFNRVRLTDL